MEKSVLFEASLSFLDGFEESKTKGTSSIRAILQGTEYQFD